MGPLGRRGPSGPQGPVGETGPAGPQGPGGFITHKGNVDDHRFKFEKYAEAIVKGSCEFLGIAYHQPGGDAFATFTPSTEITAQLIKQFKAETQSLEAEISELKAKINKAKDALA